VVWGREEATVTMTAIPPTVEPIGQLLTAEEYDALPENPRRELVDGVVHVMATPTPWHQDVVDAIKAALSRVVPRHLRVTREVEVRLGDIARRNPDVVVVRAEGFSRLVASLRPQQVVLAIEVVSPGSQSVDRVVKPYEYAAAGIAHYWRVETEPEVAVHTYQLGPGLTYVHTGTFEVGATVQASGLEWAAVDVKDLASDL
jgi:Uma2 family endonuclease